MEKSVEALGPPWEEAIVLQKLPEGGLYCRPEERRHGVGVLAGNLQAA